MIELTGDGQTVNGHLLVRVGHYAKATVVLRHGGLANYASKVEIHAADGAQLDVVSVQDWAAGSVHGGQFSVRVGANATVRTIQVLSVGSGDVRWWSGPSSPARVAPEQLGIYFAKADQHVEHRMFVDHNHPHTASHVDYRGALQGKGAHSVWIGDVLIRKQAVDIETYESNKNLMLTEGCGPTRCRISRSRPARSAAPATPVRPVASTTSSCSTCAAAASPRSRHAGLVVEGFFLDIIRRVGVPEIESRLVEALNTQLASIDGITHEAMLGDAEDEQ